MTKALGGAADRRSLLSTVSARVVAGVFLSVSTACLVLPTPAAAQEYRFTSVSIEGSQRIEPATILSYAGISQGQAVSAAELNEAFQRIQGSGLFESVEIKPQGNRLVIRVVEFPTINRISFEGNRRLKDDDLAPLVRSQSRRVFNATVAEQDAATLTEAYAQQGRVAAKVTPRIIRRSDNRVDLIFEIFEGGITEVERISFVGNQAFSDRRLRRVLESKQAGLLRAVIRSDTFVADRVEFDRQVLRDFYLSRGYVDFRTTGVNAELAQERDGYFLTFNIEEGQQFSFGEITTVSDLPEVDPDLFQEALRIRPGQTYSPTLVENSIARLERMAIREGIDFVRVEPRISRNDRDLTLDVEFALVRGDRIFVERIDIEGNATTLDRVVRRQFRVVEGDPFNPREIRESAERIRALGFFSNVEVDAREGSAPDQVIVDVDVEEAPTGSFNFGGSYSTDTGFGLGVSFSERNFLGRGQTLRFAVNTGTDNQVYSLNFAEPALLGRDLRFGLDLSYVETDNQNALYDTEIATLRPSLTFPVSDNGRLSVRYELGYADVLRPDPEVGRLISAEALRDPVYSSAIGYTYSYDTRRTGLNPNAGVLLQFSQDFAGLGGDSTYVKTTARSVAQTRVMNDEVTLRASFEGGALNFMDGQSQVTDRFFLGPDTFRGFEAAGIGPRERTDGGVNDALGGNFYAVARFEAEFPLGLPEEYGVRGGVFYDVGSLWGLDQTNSDVLYEDSSLRQTIGVSLFWTTPIGPLRFNWSEAISKERFDKEQNFNLTISTEF